MNDLAKVALTQLEVPDYDLGLRGKLVRADKLAPGASANFCTILFGLSLVDDVTDNSISNAANGYPDTALLLDESTRVEMPWRGGTEAVIAGLSDGDGHPHPLCIRGKLSSLVDEYEQLGLSPILGFEYEFWLFEESSSTGRGDLGRLVPTAHIENAYSLERVKAVESLAQEFFDRMEAIGHPVEAFHSELGPGAFEFALKPQPALKAADGAARARQHLRALCAERGMLASFMAKPFADKPGAGGHIHSSLLRDGANVFGTDSGELSEEGSRYVAGLLHHLGAVTALFSPYVNSYRRVDPEMFVTDRPTWAANDRSAACRLILDSQDSARVEHRRPGADVSPYLAATALLAGGLDGLRQALSLPDAAIASELGEAVPDNLADALVRLEQSELAQRAGA